MEATISTDLPESIFFTARKARILSNVQETSCSSEPASSSPKYYSARTHSIMERRSELSMSTEDAEIEASKDHWTVVEYFTAATRIGSELTTSGSVSQNYSESLTESERLSLYEENLKEMVRLQEANPESEFFRIGDDGLVLGRKIGEGGQAEIFDAGVVNGAALVLKVFKAGFSVSALQLQWPLALLHKIRAYFKDHKNIDDSESSLCNPILHGRLLADGRFAFEMLRLWGDLRKLMDVRMEHNGNRHPPFMLRDGNYHECCMLYIIGYIVFAMKQLHADGSLHRDLKSSNVLISGAEFEMAERQHILDPVELKHHFGCFLSDYECSIGVVGTGYWRAPEILEALKHRRVQTTPNLFTPKSDVYSFAMTFYEILTGCTPFEEVGDCEKRTLLDEVLGGRRPTLPDHLQPWVVDLMNRCWHMDPCERPTFEEIFDLLGGIENSHQGCQSISVFFEAHL